MSGAALVDGDRIGAAELCKALVGAELDLDAAVGRLEGTAGGVHAAALREADGGALASRITQTMRSMEQSADSIAQGVSDLLALAPMMAEVRWRLQRNVALPDELVLAVHRVWRWLDDFGIICHGADAPLLLGVLECLSPGGDPDGELYPWMKQGRQLEK